MAFTTRLLLLGVDAADIDHVTSWADAGHLPTFRSLLDRGTVVRVDNPIGLYPGAVWPCFYTGVMPTRHGRYSLEQIRAGTYRLEPFEPDDVKREAFWEALGRAGRRVAVVDVPKSNLSSTANVTHIADWGTHDPETAGMRFWPASIGAALTAEFGSDPVGACDSHAADLGALRDRLIRRIASKEAMIAQLLRNGGWDLLAGVFSESHCAGHHFWRLHDRRDPKHDAALAAALGEPLRDVYQAIDGALGRLIALVGDQVPVVVYGSHGIGSHHDGTHLIDEVLRRLDAAEPAAVRRVGHWSKRLRHVVPWRSILPAGLRRKGRLLARNIEEQALAADRRLRTYFQITTSEKFAGIRINLIGREPDGKVAPGAHYEAVCETLAHELTAMVNTATGRPAVRAVHRVDRLFPGEYQADFPDLLVEWTGDAPVRGLASPRIGEVRGEPTAVRSGDHRQEGFLVARAPGLKRASARASVVDIAPTVAAALGVSLSDVDGMPISELAGLMAPAPAPAARGIPVPA